jgi:hypothetical protein
VARVIGWDEIAAPLRHAMSRVAPVRSAVVLNRPIWRRSEWVHMTPNHPMWTMINPQDIEGASVAWVWLGRPTWLGRLLGCPTWCMTVWTTALACAVPARVATWGAVACCAALVQVVNDRARSASSGAE